MATNVDIDRTNITAGQMKSFWTLAGNPNGSHINRDSFGAYLERRNPFGDASGGKFFPTTTLTVDRKEKLIYVAPLKPLHSKLEHAGPPEYDLARISVVSALNSAPHGSIGSIYEHLKNAGMLQYCLGLEDGQAILNEGLDVFRTLFRGRKLFLLRSASKSPRSQHCYAPAIKQDGDGLIEEWCQFESLWRGHYLAVAYPGYGTCFTA